MHIPDGLLNAPTIAVTYAASVGGVGMAVRHLNRKLQEKQVPLMGVLAAFIFAAQMINFPVAGGTSGHLIGAALAVILLGPWSSIAILTCVLIAQCLIFQDGGLLALGANVLNMAIMGSLSASGILRVLSWLKVTGKRGRVAACFTAAWVSVVVTAVTCAVELAASGVAPAWIVIPAMTGVHAIIGIGEGLITIAMVVLVRSVRVDLLEMQKI